MGRGILSLKLISNPKSRRTTFQKRKKSLMKKAYELSTLCDVQTCIVIASEEFETWPSDRNQVEAMIRSYKSQSFCKHSAKSSYDLNRFFSDRKNKIVTETSKLREKVRKSKDTNSDHRLDSLSEHQLKALMAALDSKIGVADSMIEFMEADYDHLIEEAVEISSIDTQIFSPLETEASPELNISELGMETNYDHLIGGAAEILSVGTQTFSPFETELSPEFDVSEMFMEANYDHLIEGAAEIVSIDTQKFSPSETELSPELNVSEMFMEADYDHLFEEPTEIPTFNSLETEVFSELDISELLAGPDEFEFNVEGFQSLLEDEDLRTLAENHSFIFHS